MKKRIACLLLAALMVLGSVMSMTACLGGDATGSTCTNHVDNNHDGKCDNEGCSASGIKVEHADVNHDGICDITACGKTGLTVNHEDANHDGKCDAAACTANNLPINHTDANNDKTCDICGKAVGHECASKDDDCYCDECGQPYHVSEDGFCVNCGESTHTCVDKDNDDFCDICDEEMVPSDECTEHYDDDVDGYCDNCGAQLAVEHECYDDDGNGYCDECNDKMNSGSGSVTVDYPWSKTTLIFQMTKNTHNDELPSACERYLAGEDSNASDDIDDMVIERNQLAQYYTKVDVTYRYYSNTAEYGWGKNIERIETTTKAGGKDSPDMYCNFVYDMVGASLKSCFANLYSTSRGTGALNGLNYFEFTHEDYNEADDNRGYMYEYMTSLTLSKHKMYVLASDYFTDMIRAFFIIPVSVQLLEDFGEPITGDRNNDGKFTMDDFYAQVEAGEWTYNLLASYAAAVYKPAGDNSTGGCWLGDDRVGFAFSDGGLAASGLLYTTSVTIIHKDWDDDKNDWNYYYEPNNEDLYAFCDTTTQFFKKPGIAIVTGKNTSQWGATQLLAIRTRFAENKVLFGDIMLVGALEFEQYQTMKENGGFGIVPVPLYRENSGDKYLTQIHNVGRPGAIATTTTKFAECTAFLNYQSTHSTDILNEYYDYKLQYDVADGSKGTVKMLQYIRTNVRTSFDKAMEDAMGVFFTGAYDIKWLSIITKYDFQLDIRGDYAENYPTKAQQLKELTAYYAELPD